MGLYTLSDGILNNKYLTVYKGLATKSDTWVGVERFGTVSCEHDWKQLSLSEYRCGGPGTRDPKTERGAGEVAQQLRPLTLLPEGLRLIPSPEPHTWVTPVLGGPMPFCVPTEPGVHMVQTGRTLTHKIK